MKAARLSRRDALQGLGLAATALALPARAQSPPAPKTLRLAFRTAETGFDPARISDLYSRYVTAHIFEGLYCYDPLARPVKLKPLTAAALPEHSDDHRVWTVRLRPGIFFADDPAFRGRSRELTAQDYVYAFKRFFDPALIAPGYNDLSDQGFVGLGALRAEAQARKTPFDLDREVEGLRALDRYTLRFVLEQPRPRFANVLAGSDLFGAVAREVVERYGADIAAHPVGTGPFRLAQWRRSSRIVLERNPGHRERRYEAEPAPDDVEGQAILARLRGRRLPMVDRVDISIIEESQPRWLAFVNGEIDLIDPVPPDLAASAVPGGRLAPHLAKRGVRLHRVVNADVTLTYFNMEDPVVGGYAPAQVALRRAVVLGYDSEREIRLIRQGQAIAAEAGIPPHTYGHDPALRTANASHDPSRARALLDVYGYLDRDGDGWREQPDGSPLLLRMGTEQDQLSRQFDEQWKRDLGALGLRVVFETAQWSEHLKQARAGKLMMWRVGSTATSPDGQLALQRLYGPQAGSQNLARFRLPAFDAVFERMSVLPDGPERLALFAEATKLAVAYAPYKFNVHRVYADLSQPWLIGYRRPLFSSEFWHCVDIDTATARAART